MKKKHTMDELHQWQALPLSIKISMTKQRIRDWYNAYDGNVYVSFSGGKDSTVLLDIARSMYPEIKAVFVDTRLEYTEIRDFVFQHDNVTILMPKKDLRQVICEYGYPLISKEVSECVQGARKYLTSILQEIDALTDRQTDRQTDRPYRYNYERITGTGAYQAHTKRNTSHIPIRDGQIAWNLRTSNPRENQVGGGTITNIANSEELANILNKKMIDKSGGNNQRLAIMLGMLTNDKNHPIKANVPNKDRSIFSQEKYKFMLDAPFEISNKCCNVMKKEPVHRFAKETGLMPITAQMASESRLRTQKWIQNGCNAFDIKNPISNPMAFWLEQDVLLYIYERGLPIASVYGDVVIDYAASGQVDNQMNLSDYGIFDRERPLLKTTGCSRTGCFACGYGMHLEKPCECRIQKTIDFSDPKLADWQLRGGHFRNSDGMWEPKGGLGYWFVMEWCNKYGNMHYWYPNRDYYIAKYSTDETRRYLET